MAYGNRSIILTDLSGVPVGTPSNPIYVAPAYNQVDVGQTGQYGQDHIILVDTTGAPIGVPANILYLVKV